MMLQKSGHFGDIYLHRNDPKDHTHAELSNADKILVELLEKDCFARGVKVMKIFEIFQAFMEKFRLFENPDQSYMFHRVKDVATEIINSTPVKGSQFENYQCFSVLNFTEWVKIDRTQLTEFTKKHHTIVYVTYDKTSAKLLLADQQSSKK